MEISVDYREAAPSVVHLTFAAKDTDTTVADALALTSNAGDDADVWLHGTTTSRSELLAATGRVTNRTLLQMRRPLPADETTISTVPFTNDDLDAFVVLNNEAFEWHPEQGGLTAEKFGSDAAAPWFDPDGFRLHWIDDQLAGFCWTKIHSEPEELGEIYVIAVDPKFHGRGLGKAMTLAGLQWLSDAGLPTAMLYVESDNVAAVATYHRLGFDIHRTDTLWTRP